MTLFAVGVASQFAPARQLLTTALADVVSTVAKGTSIIGKIRLVNITSGAVTVDLEVYDGTTQQPLATGKSVPANDAIEIYDEIVPQNSRLRAKAGSNSAIWIHVLASQR